MRVLQLVEADAQQLPQALVAQRFGEQRNQHGIDGAAMAQHAVTQVLHQRALLRVLWMGVAR